MTIEVGNANNGIPMGAYVPSSGGSGGGAGGLKAVVVDTLPETGEEGILYLVPEQSSAGTNNFKEYIWLSDENKYEELGYTDIDLSDYYTKEEIDSSLSQKQDKISTVSPLKISSAVVTNQTNCTYIDGAITSLGTASTTGKASIAQKRSGGSVTGYSVSCSGINSTTDGVHVNYPFTIPVGEEYGDRLPIAYDLGYYNADGYFVSLFLFGKTTWYYNGSRYYAYTSIVQDDSIVIDGSSHTTSNVRTAAISSEDAYRSATHYSVRASEMAVGGTFYVRFYNSAGSVLLTLDDVTLTSELIAQLNKINVATYNVSSNTEGNTSTLRPVLSNTGEIKFNGDSGSSIVSNTLQLDISTGLSIVDDKLTLSPATTSTLGGVQPDGTTITTTADGIISSVADPGGTLQTQITALQTTIAEKQNTIQEEHSGMYWYNNKMWLNLANTDSYLDVYIADTTATATTGFNQSTININMTNLKNALTGGLNVIKLTQAEYDALETKDTNTMYVVVG